MMELLRLQRCRVCLGNEKILSLYHPIEENEEEQYVNLIFKHCEIQISPNDNKPQMICEKCADIIKTLFKFKRQCNESDNKFNFVNCNKSKWNICRLCLTQEGKKFSLHKNLSTNKNLKFVDVLAKCTDIQVSPDDYKPQFICLECVNILNSLAEFRRKCEASHSILNNEYSNNSQMEVDENFNKNETNLINYIDLTVSNENESLKKSNSSKQTAKICKIPNKKYGMYKICNFCNYKSIFKEKLEDHIIEMHPDKGQKCTECKAFLNESSYHSHMILHDKKTKFKCIHCALSYNCLYTLKKHIKATHSNLINCSKCVLTFKTGFELSLHYKKQHGGFGRTKHKTPLMLAKERISINAKEANIEMEDNDLIVTETSFSGNTNKDSEIGEVNRISTLANYVKKQNQSFESKTEVDEVPLITSEEDHGILSTASIESNVKLEKEVHKPQKLKMVRTLQKLPDNFQEQKSFKKLKLDLKDFQNFYLKPVNQSGLNTHEKDLIDPLALVSLQAEDLIEGTELFSLIDGGFKDANIEANKYFTEAENFLVQNEKYINVKEIKAYKISLDKVKNIKKNKNIYKKCKYCDWKVTSSLNNHIMKHHTEVCKKCPLCKKLYLSQYKLSRHISRYESNNSTTCEFCDKKLKNIGYLLLHQKKCHGIEKNYTCWMCEEHFNCLELLKCHNDIHKGLFTCRICFTSVSKPSTLNKHYSSDHNIDSKEIYNFMLEHKINFNKYLKNREQNQA